MSSFPTRRLRRLRSNQTMRDMLASVRLGVDDLISPLFVREGSALSVPIESMPGQFQFSVDTALETARRWADLGLRSVLLFGIPETKDPVGSEAWNDSSAVQRLTGEIKKAIPDMLVITDVCLCEYTDHGHCGTLLDHDGPMDVDNDATLESLARVAASHARCGADIVAPSAMMDGQVQAIRSMLDADGFSDTAIMSYAVKFASALYGPFRQAAEGAPRSGDRKTYQMDYRSPLQILSEATQDAQEGADILMVKPAWTYLDVIAEVRQSFEQPLAGYHVSGEFSVLHAAAANGWIDLKDSAIEVTSAIKRAGADLIITYFAEQLAQWI
jgi:porphobilinogen synthase